MDNSTAKSPFEIRNIRLFIAFRLFFNSRFYYPVFTILFLDFGLTLEQFALLNAAWAAAIVALEVPSGALADTIGRRNLLVAAGTFMVVEITLLCFVPQGNSSLLFTIFLINRLLSGAAEAAASGADEALAYDALQEEGDVKDWPRVLEKQMGAQAMAYIGAMSLGAAVYDPLFMRRIAHGLNWNVAFTQDITLRLPLFLTLVMAILTLATALRMHEVGEAVKRGAAPNKRHHQTITRAFKLTLQAGGWILRTPWALVIILAGLVFDNCIRMIITLNSQYYRLIRLPEASFGLIGSGIAVLGLFVPRLARKMVRRYSPNFNLHVMAGLTILGLVGMTFFLPLWGLIPVLLLFSVMYLGRFFQSHYLNQVTPSHQRATVLSFKGLSFNLAYGLIGLLYSFLLIRLRSQAASDYPALVGVELENRVFMASLNWFPWYFLLTLAALVLIARRQLQKSDVHKRPG
ncbi:MAG: MFS transporter [Desulfobacterales bacterium]|nr:MAG: MFS transporter [Desulfobacterales bacterium]